MPKNNIFSAYEPKDELTDFEIEEVDLESKLEPQESLSLVEVEEEKQIERTILYTEFLDRVEEIVIRINKGEISQFRMFDKTMKPTLKYEKSMLQAIYSKNLKRGDIVLIYTPRGYFIKRVIKFVKDGVLLLGDNEKRYTLVTDKDNILGKICAKIEKNKYISFNALKIKKKAYKKYVKHAWIRTKGRVIRDFFEGTQTQIEEQISEPQIINEDINVVELDDQLPEVNFFDEEK